MKTLLLLRDWIASLGGPSLADIEEARQLQDAFLRFQTAMQEARDAHKELRRIA